MSQQAKNPYEFWEFPAGFESKFTNAHIISHTAREFFITFGVGCPPKRKMTPVAQIVLTREHALELVLNLQSQLKKFQREKGDGTGPGR
ncbi:MAG: DUF3467 domain-containing protein [Candidatus Omnitrophica bacterium]|nr:DUF3467 domain-containing protein [Candidatus Omnitrophota bacterium]